MTENINEIPRKICLKIKIERIKRSWSQEYLSDLSGISKNTIGEIERANRFPSVLTLAKLADAFKITVSELTDISKADL